MTDARRAVPGTDKVLADPRLAPYLETRGRDAVKRAIHAAQGRARTGVLAPDDVVTAVLDDLAQPTGARPVINATGVLVHTNLGRAPLSAAAVTAIQDAAGTTDVELDLATGKRARRGRDTVAALADAVPDAGGVHVVNNNAAALLLTALTLAPGKEIVLSRGELVEIGDGFRIPDLLTSAGARLREVGTTNRTTVADYAGAIGPDTGFVLKIHPSNFLVTGFTASVPTSELAELGVPLVVDIGSGLLRPHPLLPDEPDAATALRDGATLVTASGDKLLGGPQAGLLLGDADLVERLRRHPAARAMRVDKLTLAALEATLRGPEPPVLAALNAELPALEQRAQALMDRLWEHGVPAAVVPSRAAVGGGGAPGVTLPSVAIAVPAHYAPLLRMGAIPVVGRVEQGRCLLDLRTIRSEQEDALVAAVAACA
ncbi:L-seryl-tRNA(Sec) selenium transferase [Labedaea rhizosphaerae]|uniref:L-seryl-tRNA(Sec) selenium transferase n=1 Tax=Labedaea rhizosphaerae TaxID=598644 RepID=A0A4R6SHX8_LABRH|nr:L-seryl-tRNA(Sec) selenium transferase [Labedaea rhizosphaerae]TDQ00986.1 L-seryl-tRNA(Sec) selenium transferase [Labedaea rhizosphaerae]